MHTQYTPFLWQQMEQLHRQQPFSGHTPGHKNGAFLPTQLQQAWGAQFASYDYTELDGLDNLHFSGGCIAQSQQQAAAIFGAGQCFYLVNGTTKRLSAPKKKKRMHVQLIKKIPPAVREFLDEQNMLGDETVAKMLELYHRRKEDVESRCN